MCRYELSHGYPNLQNLIITIIPPIVAIGVCVHGHTPVYTGIYMYVHVCTCTVGKATSGIVLLAVQVKLCDMSLSAVWEIAVRCTTTTTARAYSGYPR